MSVQQVRQGISEVLQSLDQSIYPKIYQYIQTYTGYSYVEQSLLMALARDQSLHVCEALTQIELSL